jgi:hypothetical protein
MATEPPSIGSAISACCHRPPTFCGISGGGSTAISPVGISGAGRRADRLITTVLMPFYPLRPQGCVVTPRTLADYRTSRRANGR